MYRIVFLFQRSWRIRMQTMNALNGLPDVWWDIIGDECQPFAIENHIVSTDINAYFKATHFNEE